MQYLQQRVYAVTRRTPVPRANAFITHDVTHSMRSSLKTVYYKNTVVSISVGTYHISHRIQSISLSNNKSAEKDTRE